MEMVEGGETMWLARHGSADQKDEAWKDFTCDGEVSKNIFESYLMFSLGEILL